MSAEFSYAPNYTIVVCRCPDCKRFYGSEKYEPSWCPHCAKDRLRESNDKIEALAKSNAALRGALKRKRQ